MFLSYCNVHFLKRMYSNVLLDNDDSDYGETSVSADVLKTFFYALLFIINDSN